MPADATLPRLVAQRRAAMVPLIRARAAGPAQFKRYAAIAERLPQWLRQHGLRLTLDYLHLLAAPTGRNQPEAAALLEDWMRARANPGQLALPQLLENLTAQQALADLGATDLLRLQALASVDAEALRQACKSVLHDLPPEDPAPWRQAPLSWPALPPHAALSLAHCHHPGVAWRFAGTVPRPSTTTQATTKTYREHQVRELARLAGRTAAAEPHHRCYAMAYDRRLRWLAATGCASTPLALRSRLFVGLGERGVWETNVLLHPVYGMPFIPASQVKNLIRRTMGDRIARMPKASRGPMQQLLDDLLGAEAGGVSQPGRLLLHDAWWVPGSAEGPLDGDLDNPHHAEYFQRRNGHDEARPQDSPQPQPQIGVRGQMLFALGLPGGPQPLLKRCLRWLTQALQQRGIGGRSHAVGAGRFA